MRKFHPNVTVGIGGSRDQEGIFSKHHFAGIDKCSSEVQRKIAEMGLRRVAGNQFVCPASHSFWQTSADGKVIRLVKSEVDEGDKLQAAPADDPKAFLDDLLENLSF
jgi:hypothetical protein